MMKIAIVLAILAVAATAMPVRHPKAPEGSIECSICEFVVGEADKLLASNKTDAEIEAEVLKLCDILPKSWGGECTALVDNYLPEILQELSNNADPATVCGKIGLCSSAAKPVKALGGVECNLCTLVAGAVEKYVAENKTESQIEGELEKLCGYTPWKTQCDSLVSQYLPQIISAIENGASPATLCADIGLCTNDAVVAAPTKPFDECSICELVVGFVEKELEKNSTITIITTELDKVCALLPGDFSSTCEALVANYLPEIIQHLEADLPPETACEAIGVCSKSKKVVVVPTKAFDECSICELVVGFVEKELEKNSTITIITTELDKVCALLPGDFASTCEALVANYLPEIIQHLEADLPPETACQAIGVCSKSKKVVAPQDDTICEVCTLVVTELESLVSGKNLNNTEIEAEAAKLCMDLPSKIQPECKLAVTVLLPTILTDLENNTPPAQICATAHLCSSSRAKPFFKKAHHRRSA